MVVTRSVNTEPELSPSSPDRAMIEQQALPRLEPGLPVLQQKMTIYSDSPFGRNVNPDDSSGLKLFIAATKGPDPKDRIILGPETATLFLQLIRSLSSLYGRVISIGLIPDSDDKKWNMLRQRNLLNILKMFKCGLILAGATEQQTHRHL